jgi:hypothetical protein
MVTGVIVVDVVVLVVDDVGARFDRLSVGSDHLAHWAGLNSVCRMGGPLLWWWAIVDIGECAISVCRG